MYMLTRAYQHAHACTYTEPVHFQMHITGTLDKATHIRLRVHSHANKVAEEGEGGGNEIQRNTKR